MKPAIDRPQIPVTSAAAEAALNRALNARVHINEAAVHAPESLRADLANSLDHVTDYIRDVAFALLDLAKESPGGVRFDVDSKAQASEKESLTVWASVAEYYQQDLEARLDSLKPSSLSIGHEDNITDLIEKADQKHTVASEFHERDEYEKAIPEFRAAVGFYKRALRALKIARASRRGMLVAGESVEPEGRGRPGEER